MSISSIMSGNEPGPSPYNSRAAIDSRRSSRASVNLNTMKQEHLPALAPPQTPTQSHVYIAPAATPLPNGDSHHIAAAPPVLPLPRPKPDEKDVEAELAKMEDIGSLDAAGQDLWREEYIQRSLKRTHELGFNEAAKRKVGSNSTGGSSILFHCWRYASQYCKEALCISKSGQKVPGDFNFEITRKSSPPIGFQKCHTCYSSLSRSRGLINRPCI